MTSLAAASVTPAYTLSGRVNDANGRAIPDATVMVTFGRASGRSARSDETGNYLLRTIPRGTVSFTVSAPGYTTATRTADVDANTIVNVTLQK